MPEGIGALGRLEPLDGAVHQREDTHVLGPPGGVHEPAPVVEAHRVEAVRQHIGGEHDDRIEEGAGRHRPPLGVLAGREHEAAQRPARRVEHSSPWRRRSRAVPGEVAGCRVFEEPRPRRIDDEAPTGEGGEALGEPRRVAAHQGMPGGIGGADHDRRRQQQPGCLPVLGARGHARSSRRAGAATSPPARPPKRSSQSGASRTPASVGTRTRPSCP